MARTADLYVDGLNEVLRAFRRLPKEAATELRSASLVIAERHMVPAWKEAARLYGGPWGDRITDSVRARKDRLPAVQIGKARKAYSGGASTNMTRYPSDKGTRGRARQRAIQFGDGTDWISQVRPYQPQAIREWGEAVDRIVKRWDNQP